MKVNKNIYIELHSQYKEKIRPLNILLGRSSPYSWYLNWWLEWIKSSPLKIKYSAEENLNFSHPLAFCNLAVDKSKFLIGFDLWDKYPLYARNSACQDPHIKKRWNDCRVGFKTNYFDAQSSLRYRAPLSYVAKEEDEGREEAELPGKISHVFPGGMPLGFGRYFLRGRYKGFRSLSKQFNVLGSERKKDNFPLRNKMIEQSGDKYDLLFVSPYKNYLKKLGQTKICIDYPSNSRVTFRTSEALSLGSLPLGPPVSNVYPQNFKLEECMSVCKADLTDFNDKIDYYLSNDKEREELTKYAMDRWDKVMSPETLSAYWLKTALNYLEEIGEV